MLFLDQDELEALLRADPARPSKMWPTDRVLYLMAAMTGLRQGELLGLRWCNIDWTALRVRVQDNYVRGRFKGPKSRRGHRSVPLADRVVGELDRHHQRSAYQSDSDLVFCHPETGKPLGRTKLVKRFKDALERAQVKEVAFHDLRHTFGTRMAAHPQVSLRQLQEWMGHRDLRTTQRYVHYQPAGGESAIVAQAFAGTNSGTNLRANPTNSDQQEPHQQAETV